MLGKRRLFLRTLADRVLRSGQSLPAVFSGKIEDWPQRNDLGGVDLRVGHVVVAFDVGQIASDGLATRQSSEHSDDHQADPTLRERRHMSGLIAFAYQQTPGARQDEDEGGEPSLEGNLFSHPPTLTAFSLRGTGLIVFLST